MAGTTSVLASAAVGSLLVAGVAAGAPPQGGVRAATVSVVRPAGAAAPGAISGVVRDEKGQPVEHCIVSALGAVTTVAVTDATGRFEFGTLTPGPYLVRAHLSGFIAPRAEMVDVRSSGRSVSSILLRREGAEPVLAAGFSAAAFSAPAAPEPVEPSSAGSAPASGGDDTTTETAWRIRHGRRGILKDATLPAQFLDTDDDGAGEAGSLLAQLAGKPGRVMSLFAAAPISGQVNFLTSGSFDSPQQLFSTDAVARNIANVRFGAPAGDRADWTVAGALTQADISSWVVAGSYATRAGARHRYDLGMSYSTQRYDGGNPLALRAFAEGSRNVGTVYAYDSVALTPQATLAFGGEYARYDYLANRTLLSPRVELTLTPAPHTRITGAVSRRALAPGAEEFLPPADAGIWLPPQRTFSAIDPSHDFRAETTLGGSIGVERDFGLSTVAVRGFTQRINDQIVTMFGADVPGQPSAKLGHYLVGTAGDLAADGVSAEFRAVIASRVHGSLRYSVARAQILTAGDDALMLLAPVSRPLPSTVQDVTARIDTEVPETATRVMVLYQLSNGFARPGATADPLNPVVDGRFDVQVRQSLPFMNFSSARWEMLLAVRNFFRDTSVDQSFFDELLVVRPPKRVVGGVTLHF